MARRYGSQGFGTFGTRSRPARTGRTPGPAEVVSISASVSPSLKAEKALRDAVNAGRRSWPWAGRRFRSGTPRIHPIWKPADYDTMTDPPGFTALLPGNPNVTEGLWAWLLPSWIRDCISGKEVMEALRIDAGQTRSPRSGVLKSRGCDTMTGASESISRWGSELRERNGLGRPDAGWCTPLGKSGRNVTEDQLHLLLTAIRPPAISLRVFADLSAEQIPFHFAIPRRMIQDCHS